MLKERLLSLDIFRGFIVIAMFMVDYPGSWNTRFPIFNHMPWNGFNAPDLIFPAFLFIMGVAMTLSLGRKLEEGSSKKGLMKGIIIRTVVLFLLGYLTNVFCGEYVRIMGVLQRIALVYFITSLLMFWLSPKRIIITGFIILLGYWLALVLIPVPGFGKPDLTMLPGDTVANLPVWVDMKILGNMVYKWTKPCDPEGLLSTLPCISTTIIGYATGQWLKSTKTTEHKTIGMYLAGVVFIIISLFCDLTFPINKNIWTSSYVVFTGGWSLVLFASFYWIIDGVKKYHPLLDYIKVFGKNALAAYFLFAVGWLILEYIPAGDINLGMFIYKYLFETWLPPAHASWINSFVFLFLWALFYKMLDNKNIYIKL